MATGRIGCTKSLLSSVSTLSFWSSSSLPSQSSMTSLSWYCRYQHSGAWSFSGRRKPMPCSCSLLGYSLSYVALGDSLSYWRWSILWTRHVSLCYLYLRLILICDSDDQAPVALWSYLEQGVGIICGCLPAFRSLLEHLFPNLRVYLGGSTNANSSSGSASKPTPYSSAISIVRFRAQIFKLSKERKTWFEKWD
jgi:hypothetical protein